MRTGVMSRFGKKLRERIDAAGFSNIKRLLKPVGINHSIVYDLENGKIRDTGIAKIATIAILLGKRPSELMADIDDMLLTPKALTPDEFRKLEIPGRVEDHDTFRLAVVVDTVLAWDEEVRGARQAAELGLVIGSLYDRVVRPNPELSTLEIRRRAMLDLFRIDVPETESKPRGRGRPPSSAAA